MPALGQTHLPIPKSHASKWSPRLLSRARRRGVGAQEDITGAGNGIHTATPPDWPLMSKRPPALFTIVALPPVAVPK